MPMYSTKCVSCEKFEDRKLTFEQYELSQKGEFRLECTCGAAVSLVFNPADVSFVLKDGQSGGFVSKAMKENAYRQRRRQVMGQRERDHVRPNTLQPNFQGQATGSWAEARDAAYQFTYNKLKGEYGEKAAARAAAQSAKTYDRKVKREAT